MTRRVIISILLTLLVVSCATTEVDQPVAQPEVRGIVTVVNPEWNFIVFNVGERAEVRPGMRCDLFRNGEFYGWARVSQVKKDKSVADVMRTWGRPVRKGDAVIISISAREK